VTLTACDVIVTMLFFESRVFFPSIKFDTTVYNKNLEINEFEIKF